MKTCVLASGSMLLEEHSDGTSWVTQMVFDISEPFPYAGFPWSIMIHVKSKHLFSVPALPAQRGVPGPDYGNS